jgi:hypothetical protein
VGQLPPYTPEEASLFGDSMSPLVFGLPVTTPPSQEPKLPRRVARGDAVVLGRISTVTEESLAGRAGYTIVVTVEGTPIRGSLAEKTVEIRIEAASPSFMSVRARGGSLIGLRMLLYLKRFDDAGEVRFHWYGDRDDPGLRDAVRTAKPLGESTGAQTRR